MLTVTESISRLLQDSRMPCEAEEIDLKDGLGRVLAAPVTGVLDVPPADNSSMDGYAIRHAECGDPERKVPISQRIAAGHPPIPLAAGSAARIFTGADIPPGADTVVIQEHCEATPEWVNIMRLPDYGANIRRHGQDIHRGQSLLPGGHRLRAQDLGLLASQGMSRLRVARRLRVALLSTGDELIEPGTAAQAGQIYNSNRYTLTGLLRGWGFEVMDLGIAPDRFEVVADLMQQAARSADVIITSGGVSVGEEDHVKAVVESLGSIDLWRIAIKPGKPFAFGHVQGTPFMGLPGNPVSVLVTLLIVGRPYLFACQGIASAIVNPLHHTALFDKPGSAREDYLRVRSSADGLELFSSQSSGVLTSTTWGDGLVRQSIGEDIRCGGPVDFLPYALLT